MRRTRKMIRNNSALIPAAPRVMQLLLLILVTLASCAVLAEPILVGSDEDGSLRTGQAAIWHDPENTHSPAQAAQAFRNGEFQPLQSAGSTGLKEGAYWSHFTLHNTSGEAITLHLEYIDHQLIELTAYAEEAGRADTYRELAHLSMLDPFAQRPVSHNRFVLPLQLKPGEEKALLVKFSSDEVGFVFPAMRIWSPENLRSAHTLETAGVAFLFGGFFLMSIFSLVAGIATRSRTFFVYSFYALSKIATWATILGFTHQYLIRNDFQWHYMSSSAAISILCGTAFARLFLQSRKYTPRLDIVLRLMMANAALLLVGALLHIKPLALITITLALLLYPVITLAGIVRWRQGSGAAAVFAFAWSLLVISLFVQALRDMGLVEHNLLNYYLPPIASFIEMLTIMAAMGIRVRSLSQQKRSAEQQYRQHLEHSKAELENLVSERTRELEVAKLRAELEACTDPLTGTRNRRSFIADAERHLKLARRNGQPVSLLMFDIDHFKTINDSHGHGVGDEALCRFSQTILGRIRESDVFGRLGGEEFGLLLTESQENALHTAERLRDAIAGIRIATGNDTLTFTSSIGIAHEENSCDLDTLFKKADKALYEAKRSGRDIVVEYREATHEVEPA